MYEHVISEALRAPWAMMPEKMAMIREVLAFRASGQRWTKEEIAARLQLLGGGRQTSGEVLFTPSANLAAVGGRGVSSQPGVIAVLPIMGVIQNRVSEMDESSGMVGINTIGRRFEALVADPNVRAIVLDIDSPGGMVFGTPEFAAQIFASRERKKTVGLANQMAASAAYYLLTAASECYCSPSGEVGSVGVYSMHIDQSKALEMEGFDVSLVSAGKYKVERNPFAPLSDEARADMQAEVDHYYAMFVNDVAKHRGVSSAVVRSDFGQGRVLPAQAAAKAKMIDGVRTLDQVIAKLGGASSSPGTSVSSAQTFEFSSADREPVAAGVLTTEDARRDIAHKRKRLHLM